MAGVMSISLGCGPAACCTALMESAERIWCPSQPIVSIHHRSRLGSCGSSIALGLGQRKALGSLGGSWVHIPVAGGILDRTDIFRIVQRKLVIFIGGIRPVLNRGTHHCIESQD